MIGRLAQLLGLHPAIFVLAVAVFAPIVVGLLLQASGLVKSVPLGYNFRNLVVRWKTTLLTALAFVLVIGLLTVMGAFVNGMYALTESSGNPGNVMVLADGATDEAFSDLGYGDIDTIMTRPFVKKARLRYGDREMDTPLVSWELYQVINQPIANAKPGGRQRRFIQLRGIDDPQVAGIVHDLPLHAGGAWFDMGAGVQPDPEHPSETLVQAVIGEGLARELGPDAGKAALQVGDTFELGPKRWVVVGVMKSAGKTYDSEVWAKRKLVGEMFRKDKRSTAVLRVADGEDAHEVADWLTANFKSPAVNAKTEIEYFDSLNGTNRLFLGAIIFVTFFIGVGGVFGVMNTMFAAIAQRTRDIGVLRILGFSRRQVLESFLLESLLLALFGGLLGCAVGSLCNGWTATSIIGGAGGGGKSVVLQLVVDRNILCAGLSFAVLMGYLGGFFPALSAVLLRPLEALR